MAKKKETQSAFRESSYRGVAKEKPRSLDRKTKSYRVGQDVHDQVKAMAKQHNVEIGELVRFLMLSGLDGLANGRLQLPEREEQPSPSKLKI